MRDLAIEVRERYLACPYRIPSRCSDPLQGAMVAAERGALSHWETGPESLAALLVLLDQFPRGVYPSAERFKNDAAVKSVCLRALQSEVGLTGLVDFVS